jgi:hypothetical protein
MYGDELSCPIVNEKLCECVSMYVCMSVVLCVCEEALKIIF